jgi:hypothetical protein
MRWPEPNPSIFHPFTARARWTRVHGRKGGIERLKDLSPSSCTSPLPIRRAHAGRVPGRAYREPNSPKPNGGGEGVGRYFPARVASLRPREQPRLATEFVSRPGAGSPRGGVGTPSRQVRDVGQRGRTRGQRARAVAGGIRGAVPPADGPVSPSDPSSQRSPDPPRGGGPPPRHPPGAMSRRG